MTNKNMFQRRQILQSSAAGLVWAAIGAPAFSFAAAAKPKIGIIGAGRIGGKLGEYWAKAGYQVMLSARDLGPVNELVAKIGANAKAGTPKEAAAFGDIVMISVPFGALPQVGKDFAAELKGKIVLDTCNPSTRRDGDMANEAIQKGTGVVSPTYLPGTRYVRAFNPVPFTVVNTEAHRAGEQIGVPIASNDKAALEITKQLVIDAGFEPVVVGDLSTAKSFDPGTPVYGKGLAASELRAQLGVK